MTSPQPVHRSADAWVFLVLWVLAIAPGPWATRGVDWPYDADGFRDVAIAQHAREGRLLRDPFYAREAAWYSPLVPAVVGLSSAALGIETPAAHGRLGAWVNALAPVAFWVFVRSACGAWPALFAAAAFMFLPGRPPAWASATYSPWLFPSVTAQIPFYAGLTLIVRNGRTASLRGHVLLGAVIAATFLAHAAAAMILGGIAAATWCWNLGRAARPDARRLILAALATLATAGILTAPFLLPLATRYGFQVLNRTPATWSDGSATFASLFDYRRAGSIVQWLIAIYGAARLIRLRKDSTVVLAAWGLLAAAALLYAELTAVGSGLPTLVPAFHFFFLLRAWKWVIFGAGLAALAHAVARAAVRRSRDRLHPSAVVMVLAGVMTLSVYPRYLGREAFTAAPGISHRLGRTEDRAVYEWIRAQTTPSAVFLADDEDALRIAGPAGRSVVCVSPAFSNPYVSYEARAAARDRMFALAAAGDRVGFVALARPFGVTHVLARKAVADALRARGATLLEEVFAAGTLVVFKVADRDAVARHSSRTLRSRRLNFRETS